MKKVIVACLALGLCACGSNLNGTYSDARGTFCYTFNSDGKVIMSAMGIESETEYRVEDGKVKIGPPHAAQVFTILDDGSIQGLMGMKLTKKTN